MQVAPVAPSTPTKRPLATPTDSPNPLLLSASGRPRRSVSAVNYAEAIDDTNSGGSGKRSCGGSGGSRKRNFSPAKVRVRTPKSLMKQIMAAANKKNQDGDSDQDDDDSIEVDEDDDEATVKGKSKATLSLNFGTMKKKQTGPSPKYVTNFVIACEQICSRDQPLLASYHQALTKLLPINPAALDKIRLAMEAILSKRIVERIETQLNALGPNGAPSDLFLSKAARSPLLSTCSNAKCRTTRSFLTSICTECKSTKGLTLNPYIDWREAVLKQQELDASEVASKSTASASAKKKKVSSDDSGSESPTDSPSPSPMPLVTDAEVEAPSSPNKRRKTPGGGMTIVSSPSPQSPMTPSKPTRSLALESIPVPDAKWILDAREAITIRAIEWLRTCMAKAKNHEFGFHGGDIIFLLRNAIFKGRGEVSKRADSVVREMIGRWDSTTLTIIGDSSEPNHILVYSECLHAKKEMKCGTDSEIRILCERVRSALTNHCAEDILRFDASLYQDRLPLAAYCFPCGVFHTACGRKGACPECGGDLRMEPDFEFLCESLVWVSLFRELGISPVVTADARVSLDDILALMKHIRPYRSLEQAGTDSYKLQCYFLTHLTFVMTCWGSTAMTPRSLFVEEYLFLLANMDVVIKVKDPELVGEFLQALHILDTPHSHPVMQKGYHFLLTHEKKGKMRGNWMAATDEFYKRYHAAYCGIIGAAEFEFDPTVKFDTQFNHHFE